MVEIKNRTVAASMGQEYELTGKGREETLSGDGNVIYLG